WDVRPGRGRGVARPALALKGHTGFVTGVAFRPDGARLCSVAWDGTVKVWDAKVPAEAPGPPRPTPAFLPMGMSREGGDIALATGSGLGGAGGEVRLLDAAGRDRLQFKVTPPGHPHALDFGPGGRRLAAVWHLDAARETYALKVWDAATGKEVL